jgi:hypothetical protein
MPEFGSENELLLHVAPLEPIMPPTAVRRLQRRIASLLGYQTKTRPA